METPTNISLEKRIELLKKIEKLEEELKNVKGTKCEVYSRIVGYFSPTSQWNNGKKEEFKDRVMFDPNIKTEKYINTYNK